jgi:hypothetical protein
MNRAETHLRIVSEAQMPSDSRRGPARSYNLRAHKFRTTGGDVFRLTVSGLTAFLVVLIYVGVPIALLAGDLLDSLLHAALLAGAAVVAGAAIVLGVLHSTNLDVDSGDLTEPVAEIASSRRVSSEPAWLPRPIHRRATGTTR